MLHRGMKASWQAVSLSTALHGRCCASSVIQVHVARSLCWLQGQLRPAYSLAPAPGMTKELSHAKNARDATRTMQVRRC